MKEEKPIHPLVLDKPFYLRKLTKSGSTRYLSVGTILPQDWEIVKVFVERLEGGTCVLRLELIK